MSLAVLLLILGAGLYVFGLSEYRNWEFDPEEGVRVQGPVTEHEVELPDSCFWEVWNTEFEGYAMRCAIYSQRGSNLSWDDLSFHIFFGPMGGNDTCSIENSEWAISACFFFGESRTLSITTNKSVAFIVHGPPPDGPPIQLAGTSSYLIVAGLSVFVIGLVVWRSDQTWIVRTPDSKSRVAGGIVVVAFVVVLGSNTWKGWLSLLGFLIRIVALGALIAAPAITMSKKTRFGLTNADHFLYGFIIAIALAPWVRALWLGYLTATRPHAWKLSWTLAGIGIFQALGIMAVLSVARNNRQFYLDTKGNTRFHFAQDE